MSQRLRYTTNWIWCVLIVQAGRMWSPVQPVTVRTPPNNPATIEAQAKFFQDFFSVQLSPYKIEFGHVCEDPNTWEQRYEKKDFENHRDMGKVRWGDKKGGYGEHYWDLNHAGHTDGHGVGYDSDDGSYREDDHDTYDERSNQSPHYSTGEYGSEESNHEENNRAKRAHSRQIVQTQNNEKVYDGSERQERIPPAYRKRKSNQRKQYSEQEENTKYVEDKKHQRPNTQNNKEVNKEEDNKKPKEKNDIILVVNHKDDNNVDERNIKENKQNENYERRSPDNRHHKNYDSDKSEYRHYANNEGSASEKIPHENYDDRVPENRHDPSNDDSTSNNKYVNYDDRALENVYPKNEGAVTANKHLVPYEGGAGVRQHYHPELTASATSPRLFLEPASGHIIDRSTGQAYVLQPVIQNYY